MLSAQQNADKCRRYKVSCTVGQGQRTLFLSLCKQTKKSLCEISQTKVKMSRYGRVQQIYRTTRGMVGRSTAGCQNKLSLLLLKGLCKSSEQMGRERLITDYRLIYTRLQLKKFGLHVPGSFFLSSIWSQTGLCYISVTAWPEMTSNTHWQLKDDTNITVAAYYLTFQITKINSYTFIYWP